MSPASAPKTAQKEGLGMFPDNSFNHKFFDFGRRF
jgi:hypothetical protein